MLVSLVKRLSTLNRKVNIHWIPAHHGEPGNEEAAKEWRTTGSQVNPVPFNLPKLISTAKQAIRPRPRVNGRSSGLGKNTGETATDS